MVPIFEPSVNLNTLKTSVVYSLKVVIKYLLASSGYLGCALSASWGNYGT